jgi:hypothetical protein
MIGPVSVPTTLADDPGEVCGGADAHAALNNVVTDKNEIDRSMRVWSEKWSAVMWVESTLRASPRISGRFADPGDLALEWR